MPALSQFSQGLSTVALGKSTGFGEADKAFAGGKRGDSLVLETEPRG